MKMTLRLRNVFLAMSALAMLFPVVAVAQADACNYSEAARASWAAYLDRTLQNHDPSNAAQMGKLATAIIYGQSATVMSAIDSGLSPNTLLKTGAVPATYTSLLTLAAAACQGHIAHLLIAAGATVNKVGTGNPPLAVASAKGEVALAELLIQNGAKVDETDADGRTALWGAVSLHQPDVVELLLDHGASISTANAHTLLENLSQSSDPRDQETAKILRTHGAAH